MCDGMSYDEVKQRMPGEFAARQEDKLRYRYPRGESYEDVIRRVEPVIIELERQRKPILIVAHRATLRCLYAYFADDFVRDDVPHIDLPLNFVFKLRPGPYGTQKEQVDLSPSHKEQENPSPPPSHKEQENLPPSHKEQESLSPSHKEQESLSISQ